MPQIKELWIRKADVIQLYDWVDENEPYEACALLLGQVRQGIAAVEEVILTPNTSKSSVHFEIDPELLLKILLEAIEKKRELVSIFHSHPTSPYPSGVDIPYMKNYPDTVWLIKGLPKTERIHGYQWVDNQVVEIKVKIIH
ncbi:MAG: M67 family peptidase [Promethearchaeota archaeon]|nr:MAG: M67 family peptidase [Candidatus Lokiarchaeota archaeon]